MYSNVEVRKSFQCKFELNTKIKGSFIVILEHMVVEWDAGVTVCLTTRAAVLMSLVPLHCLCPGMQDDCENIKCVIGSLPPRPFSSLPLHSEMKRTLTRGTVLEKLMGSTSLFVWHATLLVHFKYASTNVWLLSTSAKKKGQNRSNYDWSFVCNPLLLSSWKCRSVGEGCSFSFCALLFHQNRVQAGKSALKGRNLNNQISAAG